LECRAAVLAPPTGNGVLNQIPVGDSRESSREQAVPDDGASLHRAISCWGLGDHLPPLIFHGVGGRAASLTHKKKKKKKWKEAEVGPDHYFHVVPTGQPLSSRPGVSSGLKVVAGSWDPSWCSRPIVAVVAQRILQQRHAQGTTQAVSPP